jgi:Arc/MetJ-type ribon-helix-helix transcriptional regulator
MSTKISASLPDEDVVFLDEYVSHARAESRSAALHQAIVVLRNQLLADDYAAAYSEWAESEDAELWDDATGDGVA